MQGKGVVNMNEHINAEQIVRDMLDNYSSQPRIRIMFCGCFKSGKSSLINALLGIKLLPVQTMTTTAVITRIFYSDSLYAYAISDGKRREIPFHEIDDYIMLKKKTLDAVEMPDATEVGIGIPYPLLKAVELIDSPGLDDDDDLTRITLSEIPNTDIAVIVYDAKQLLSKSEKNTVKEINKLLGGNVAFVVNRTDEVKASGNIEEVREAANYYLGKLGGELAGKGKIFYTSADGRDKDVADFGKWLNETVNNPALLSRIRKTSRMSVIKHYLSERLGLLADDIESTESELNGLKVENNSLISQELAAKKKELRQLRNDLSLHKSQMIAGVAGCAQECESAFSKLKAKPGWSSTYQADTKEITKSTFTNYASTQISMLKKSCDLKFITLTPLNLYAAINELAFPDAYKLVCKDRSILAGLAGAGAGLLAFAINPRGGGAAIVNAYKSVNDTIMDFSGEKSVLNTECVSDSTTFVTGTVVSIVQERIEAFFRSLNEKIKQYENNLSFTGGFEAKITALNNDLAHLEYIGTRFDDNRKELDRLSVAHE